MQIWRHTIKELERLLTNYGIFRDVRVWGLTSNEHNKIQIRRGIGSTAKNQPARSASELIDSSGRRLVLVVSDCVSDLWLNGSANSALNTWANNVPTAIIQMLPKWLWARTALGWATEVTFQGLAPAVSNRQLIANTVSLWSEIDEATGIKVPVFTLERDPVANWAQMLVGKGSIQSSGYVFKPEVRTLGGHRSFFNFSQNEKTAEQLVKTFRVTASPMARKLAGLLASAPVISLPVVRLIRETMLKDSQQVHVAEVLLGGLLKPLSEIKVDTTPDYIQYGFIDGVRELLVDSVPSTYVLNVIDELSKFFAKKVGLSLEEFTAVLKNPQQISDSNLVEQVQPFAMVTAQILRRLGGKYTKVADELEFRSESRQKQIRNEELQAKIQEAIEKQLPTLDLSNSQISKIPESIGNLSNLTRLILSNNLLTKLPESIGNLSNLTELYLDNNQLTKLPESIANICNLTELSLEENPLILPPIEVVNEGINGIKEYLRQLKEKGEEDYTNEAYLLVFGESEVDKTRLVNNIVISNPKYSLKKNELLGEEIDVINWGFLDLDRKQKKIEFKVKIVVFGRQELYYDIFRFFQNKRSICALVVDTSKDYADYYYLLKMLKVFSDNSPLLIIQNEKQNPELKISEAALKEQFANLKEIIATNFLVSHRGSEEILNKIKYYIKSLPHMKQIIPKTWVKVWQALEKDSRNYITLQEYLEICEANGLTQHEDKLQLSRYLHNLGVCFHFQDSFSLLYNKIILKPEWVINAVDKVLNSTKVINNQGHFTYKDIKKIWKRKEYTSMREELLELMNKLRLCYKINSSKNTFIISQLLSEHRPEYYWNTSNNFILRYTYSDFMPKEIVSRIIVALHQYIDQQKNVWKHGVILAEDNAKAEIIEYYDKREIIIRVAGNTSNNRRNLITLITHEIDNINNSYKHLKYQKSIL